MKSSCHTAIGAGRTTDTGVHKRPTIGHTGHARLRTVLYLASLSAAQHNPAIKPFYDRLRAAGKFAKVARYAAARKLLHIAWTVATKGQPFDPQYHERQHAKIGASPTD